MELRPEALAELRQESWARGTERRRERWWLGGPIMSLGLLVLAGVLAFVIPSPERVTGRGVVRLPDTAYLRSEASGGIAIVAIAPGDPVAADQAIVRLDNPEVEGELRRARRRYDEALAAMLRSPRPESLRSAVGEARVAVAELRDRHAALTLRSPVAGHVVSVRAREGGLVKATDIVASITPEGARARPYLVASFPDATLGVIEPGTELELVVNRSGEHRHRFVVRSVAHEAISISDPLQRRELATPEGSDSVVVVEAEFIDEDDAGEAALFDGMVGEVRALVRRRSLFERITEAMGWRARA